MEAAARLTNGVPRVARRVDAVRTMFGLQQLGVECYWACVGLLENKVKSETEARQAIEEAIDWYRTARML